MLDYLFKPFLLQKDIQYFAGLRKIFTVNVFENPVVTIWRVTITSKMHNVKLG